MRCAVIRPVIEHALSWLIIGSACRPGVFKAFVRFDLEKFQSSGRLFIPFLSKQGKVFSPTASGDVGEQSRGEGREVVETLGGGDRIVGTIGDEIRATASHRFAGKRGIG